MSEDIVPVTQADNNATVALTEWLILHDFFEEDGPPHAMRLQELFGEMADEAFARHRIAAATELERLRAENEAMRVLLQETKNGLIGNTAIILGGKNRDEAHKAGSRLNALVARIDAALSNEGEG